MKPLDRRDRRWALAFTAASAVVILVLAARVHRSRTPLWIDYEGQRVANGHVFGITLVPVGAAHRVVSLGSTPIFTALVVAVVIVALLLRDRIAAVVAVVAAPLAVWTTEFAKPLVARRSGDGDAFPSGHTAAIATLVAVLALVAYRRWGKKGLLAAAPVALLVPAMALALVRINWHLFSDTIAGALLGGGTVLGLAWLASVIIARRDAVAAERSRNVVPPREEAPVGAGGAAPS